MELKNWRKERASEERRKRKKINKRIERETCIGRQLEKM